MDAIFEAMRAREPTDKSRLQPGIGLMESVDAIWVMRSEDPASTGEYGVTPMTVPSSGRRLDRIRGQLGQGVCSLTATSSPFWPPRHEGFRCSRFCGSSS